MIIKQEQFIPKDTVETTIDLLIRNLTTIKDNTGEFLLDFDGLKLMTKVGRFGTGRKALGCMVYIRIIEILKVKKLYK